MDRIDPAFTALAGMLTRMQKDLRSQGRASQAAFRSVEAADGPVRYYAPGADGEVLGEIVAGPGGIEVRPMPHTPPATPTAPDAIGVQGGIVVKFDGTFINANWSATMSHVEVHRGTTLNFTPSDQTIIGTYTSYWGGEVWYAASPVEGAQYFRLITVDRAGGRSAPSDADSATALATHVGSDGEAPDTSPTPVVRGGVGALFVSWTPVGNGDPVDYYVHLSTVDNFAPHAGTLVAETAGSSVVLKNLPNGDALAYDTIYYVKIVAEDVDGAAPASAQGGASMMQVTGDDIAVNYVYAGSIFADQIEGGTMRSAVTIAGLFQTATAGGRVEMGPFGIRVYDANGVDVNVDLTGALNRFRGSIDAVDIIIRDALQMFGKNNIMGVGSELALASATSAPAQAPTMAWDYEARPGFYPANFGWFTTGVHAESATAAYDQTLVYLQRGRYKKANGAWWEFPQVPNPSGAGDTRASFKPWHMTRISNSAGSASRVVMIGEDYTHPQPDGYPEIWIRVYDDTNMVADGSVAPTLLTQYKMYGFSWFREYRLVRMVNGGTFKNWFMVMESNSPINGGVKDFKFTQYRLEADNVTVSNQGSINFPGLLEEDETLAGGLYGGSATMLLPDVAGTLMVVQTNKRNMVYNLSTASWVTAAYWPVTYNVQSRTFATGPAITNLVDAYMTYNWGAGDDPLVFRYANNFKNNDRTLWASYAWRGEATKSYMTEDSARTSIAYRRGARLRVTVPSLPAPAAGVGQPRNVNVDPYGWVYYMGEGALEPANAQMYKQAVQPNLVPGVASTQSTIDLSTYPALAGDNPVLSATFPTSTPARIKSTGNDANGDPLLLLNGAGRVKGTVFEGAEPVKEAFLGKTFNQLWAMDRIRSTMMGGGNRTSNVSAGTGLVKWSQRFVITGWTGIEPDLGTQGHFQIDMPAVGTVIPVHGSLTRTSLVVGSTGITLNAFEALWYEIPFGANKNSIPGNFHVIEFSKDDAFLPPANWVLIVAFAGEWPWFRWGDGWTKEEVVGRDYSSINLRPFVGMPPNGTVYNLATWSPNTPNYAEMAHVSVHGHMRAAAGVAGVNHWLDASYDNVNWTVLAYAYHHNNGDAAYNLGPNLWGEIPCLNYGAATMWFRLRGQNDPGGQSVGTMYAAFNVTYKARRG